MNRRLAIILGVLIAAGATVTYVGSQRGSTSKATRIFDRRCRGGCTDTALLRVLPGGVSPSLIAAGTLSGSKGQTITTTRASNKTCTRADGTVTYLSSNVPCVESAGLLVEGASTNVALQSAFASGWTNQNSTCSTFTAPDGTTSGCRLTDNVTVGAHYFGQSMIPGAGTYTASVYGHYTGGIACLTAGNLTGTMFAVFNFSTGTAPFSTSATPTIAALASGFYRASITITTAGADGINFILNPGCTNSNGPSYSGSGQSLDLWGADVEAQPFATSYIPTGAATATRALDMVTVTNPLTALAPFCAAVTFTPEGTWAATTATDRRPLQFGGVSAANSFSMAIITGTTYWVDYDGAAAFKGVNFAYAPASGSHRFIGCKPTTTTYTATLDGAAVGSAAGAGTGLASMPGTMYLGGNTSPAFGWLSDVCVANAVGACL
jgi:hypothetical protein